jgi:CHAT domain-containing protein
VSKEPEYIISAAKYFRHIRDPGLPGHAPFAAFLRQVATAFLATTLALQLELKACNIVQTLEELAVITHELLDSDPSNADTTRAITLLTGALSHEFPQLFPSRPLNLIIECLRLARMRRPEIREVPFFLAKCLCARYVITVNNELDEAASILDELIASSSPGDKVLARCQELVPRLAMIRFVGDSDPETTEDAIYRARSFLASSSAEDTLYPIWSHVLKHAMKKRFIFFDPIRGLESSFSNLPPSQIMLADQSYLISKKPPIYILHDRIRSNDFADIDEAIESGRTILSSSDPNDLDTLQVFGSIIFEAFKRTGKIESLNESIGIHRRLLAHPTSKFLCLQSYFQLFKCLGAQFKISTGHREQNLHEVVELVELLSQWLNDGSASAWLTSIHRFHLASIWAFFGRLIQHPSVTTAYDTALSLMQDALFFAPTLQLQHVTLDANNYYHKTSLDYASYQINLGQLEEAIETLERGRALLWSEMRHLRASIDKLQQVQPELGHRFADINRELEELTKSIPPSHKLSMDDVVADDLRAGDQFGRLLRRQRGLVKERDRLSSQIRTLPDFDRFLTSPSFSTLRSAASSGPVIIINHAIWRSDILILHNSSTSLIPTPDGFHGSATALKDKLLDSRVNDGLDSKKHNDTLASVLVELYKLIGRPVIDRLRQLQVPQQSRIWWCPTSVFCSLPLHAMGPVPSDDGKLQYFLDLYISSYTPSLSALIQSRTRDSGLRSSGRPSVLLVAQPDPSLPTVSGELQVVQALDTKVTSLISEAATPTTVTDGIHHHQFVHFACHGTLKPGKPFEAGFELYGGKRLTLLEIVRSDLPTAEFAFLSACHTAEVTEGSIMDEGLHLAAAIQHSGFRSVVGTTWAMVDEDGRDLAENFYKALFSDSKREQGIPYHERSAKALRLSVKKLRRKRWITLERWVNFVHYGA